MNVFMKRIAIGFVIGFSMSSVSAFAASPDRQPANNTFKERKGFSSREMISGTHIFAESETYLVRTGREEIVLNAMNNRGLAEDVDFAWMNRTANAKVVSFVCYSTECYSWAKKNLRTISVAPARPEAKIGLQWRDRAIDEKKAPTLTEDEKIKQSKMLRYSTRKEG